MDSFFLGCRLKGRSYENYYLDYFKLGCQLMTWVNSLVTRLSVNIISLLRLNKDYWQLVFGLLRCYYGSFHLSAILQV